MRTSAVTRALLHAAARRSAVPIRVSSGCVPGGHPARTVFSWLCVRSGAAQQNRAPFRHAREARRKRAPDGRPGVCYRCIDEIAQRLRPGKLTAGDLGIERIASMPCRVQRTSTPPRRSSMSAGASVLRCREAHAPVVRWLAQRPPGTGRVVRLGVYTYAESDIAPIQYFIRRLSDFVSRLMRGMQTGPARRPRPAHGPDPCLRHAETEQRNGRQRHHRRRTMTFIRSWRPARSLPRRRCWRRARAAETHHARLLAGRRGKRVAHREHRVGEGRGEGRRHQPEILRRAAEAGEPDSRDPLVHRAEGRRDRVLAGRRIGLGSC